MNIPDLFHMAVHNLWVRKGRTGLNLVGVVIGSVLLLITLAASVGIQKAVYRFVENSEHARKFRIYPDFDRSVKPPNGLTSFVEGMSDRRRNRLQKYVEENWRQKNQRRNSRLTWETLGMVRRFNHVTDVSPLYAARCDIAIGNRRKTVLVRSCSPFDRGLSNRIITGNFITNDDCQHVIVHEGLAYEMGFRSDKELNSLINQEIVVRFPDQSQSNVLNGTILKLDSIEKQVQWIKTIEDLISGKSFQALDSASQEMIQRVLKNRNQGSTGPQARIIEKRFRVGGIFRGGDEEDVQNVLERFFGGNGGVLLHHAVFESQFKETLSKAGVSQADVYVTHYDKLKSTIESCRNLSTRAVSATTVIDRIVGAVERYKFIMGIIVAIILAISSLGISNTIMVSLVERTEEIGIMKSVGAGNRDILKLILLEGWITGLLGGVIAIGIGFCLGLAANDLIREYVVARSRMQLEGMIFQVDGWMILTTLLLAMMTTTLAGLWPAWRASRIDPVAAMNGR